MQKNIRVGLQKLSAFIAAVTSSKPVYTPTRPGLIRKQEAVGQFNAKGKRRRASYALVERLVDQSRYSGAILREIRAGRLAQGHTCNRERQRRLARGCVQ